MLTTLAFSVASLSGLYWGLRPYTPDLTPHAMDKISPTAAQLAFLEKISNKCNFVCLGDTCHKHAEISAFVYNGAILDRLAKTKKNILAIEMDATEENKYLLALGGKHIKGTLPLYEEEYFKYRLLESSSSWIKRETNEYILGKIYDHIKNINTDDLQILPIDSRPSRAKNFNPADHISTSTLLFILPIAILALTQKKLFGKNDLTSPLISLPLAAILYKLKHNYPDKYDDLRRFLLDDTNPANAILETKKDAAIFYGAGHFKGMLIDGGNKSMAELLRQSGKKVMRIDIYKDTESERKLTRPNKLIRARSNFMGMPADPADAIFYVHPPVSNPNGIKIINQDLKTIYHDTDNNAKFLSLSHY